MSMVSGNFSPLLYFRVILFAQLLVIFTVCMRFLLLLLYCFMCPPTKLAFCPVLTPGSQGPPGWSVKCLGRRKNVPANCSSATQSVAKSLLSHEPQDHYLNLHWWRAPSLPPFPRCILTLTRIFCKLYIIESTIMFIFCTLFYFELE